MCVDMIIEFAENCFCNCSCNIDQSNGRCTIIRVLESVVICSIGYHCTHADFCFRCASSAELAARKGRSVSCGLTHSLSVATYAKSFRYFIKQSYTHLILCTLDLYFKKCIIIMENVKNMEICLKSISCR